MVTDTENNEVIAIKKKIYWNSWRRLFERGYAKTQRHIDGVTYPWPCEPWDCLCRTGSVSLLLPSGPPLWCFLLSSLSIQKPCTLDPCSIVIVPAILSPIGSEIYTPLAQTCLHHRSDFNSTLSWEVYYIGFYIGT